jgi:hypothetical protein
MTTPPIRSEAGSTATRRRCRDVRGARNEPRRTALRRLLLRHLARTSDERPHFRGCAANHPTIAATKFLPSISSRSPIGRAGQAKESREDADVEHSRRGTAPLVDTYDRPGSDRRRLLARSGALLGGSHQAAEPDSFRRDVAGRHWSPVGAQPAARSVGCNNEQRDAARYILAFYGHADSSERLEADCRD